MADIEQGFTSPFGVYILSFQWLVRYMAFVEQLAYRFPPLTEPLIPPLGPPPPDPKTTGEALGDENEQSMLSAWRQLGEFQPLMLQMTLASAVDDFLTYIAQLLALIYRTKPQMLKSAEQVRIDFVLQHESMDDLIDALADRKVTSLAYQSLTDLNEELLRSTGFTLFTGQEELDKAVLINLYRNLIVHNRAIVDRAFLSKVRSSPHKFGDPLRFDVPTILDYLSFLKQASESIDRRAIEKFSLPIDPEYARILAESEAEDK